jgi:hypothetical protein
MVRAIYGERDVHVRWLLETEGGKPEGKQPNEPHLFWCSADAYIESQREQPKVRGFK